LAGDGGISMLFGELMTVVQEQLPIKIAVFDNGKLGFCGDLSKRPRDCSIRSQN
jgi:thiamine pyrophosphate-dependent acetolactate synthase large subunit-like protein